jgi:hypothetical protein
MTGKNQKQPLRWYKQRVSVNSASTCPMTQGANKRQIPIEIVVKADKRHYASVRNPDPRLSSGF